MGGFSWRQRLVSYSRPFFNLRRRSPKSATCKRLNAKSYKAFFMTRWMTSSRIILFATIPVSITCRFQPEMISKLIGGLRPSLVTFYYSASRITPKRALTCREFQILKIAFRSVIVHEDFENGLSKKDQARITSAADKQFTSDFQANAEQSFSREADPVEIQ